MATSQATRRSPLGLHADPSLSAATVGRRGLLLPWACYGRTICMLFLSLSFWTHLFSHLMMFFLHSSVRFYTSRLLHHRHDARLASVRLVCCALQYSTYSLLRLLIWLPVWHIQLLYEGELPYRPGSSHPVNFFFLYFPAQVNCNNLLPIRMLYSIYYIVLLMCRERGHAPKKD
jgi:hypothetical protein